LNSVFFKLDIVVVTVGNVTLVIPLPQFDIDLRSPGSLPLVSSPTGRGYLELAIEESAEDPSAVLRALGVIARTQNMSELARRVGMSRDGLYKALSADGNPTWSTILKVTTALGLRFELHSVP
jgi:probable addiction module antidote protein